MSIQSEIRRKTAPDIRGQKGKTPLVCLTAYTAHMARILDPHVDVLLVGDSLGMVVYGLPSTVGVTLEMMVSHGAAVVRGTRQALVVVDMPFGSYQESREQAFRSCARVMAETGAGAVKLEGGVEMADTIRFLVERGIPVMGHIGLRPQLVNVLGGFRTQGRDEAAQKRIMEDMRAVSEAGSFSLVIEAVVENLANALAEACPVPTIGIGASATCDGQILVTEDMLGLSGDFVPKFVRRFGDLGTAAGQAVAEYAAAVRARTFPGPEHVFRPKNTVRSEAVS
ncbi:MAG: 3-methyl-2-oxobutanoate hydroxymethyltransferase [Pseudomonadota bacterium]|nr:3-methyl-2-oxobutanoate hydroxymethyltransferase [Pseudomonadota bacterium]